MPKSDQGLTIPIEIIEGKIFILRGHRVMIDRDLAGLYGAPVKRLNEQVKRNSDRFPDDFMFQLTLEEGKAVLRSRSQIATLERGQNIKYRPYAFTEHGAVMLANVLRSPVAIRASIQVVRRAETVDSKLLATETAHDRAVDHGAAQLREIDLRASC